MVAKFEKKTVDGLEYYITLKEDFGNDACSQRYMLDDWFFISFRRSGNLRKDTHWDGVS